jgi:hypothetical protein
MLAAQRAKRLTVPLLYNGDAFAARQKTPAESISVSAGTLVRSAVIP